MQMLSTSCRRARASCASSRPAPSGCRPTIPNAKWRRCARSRRPRCSPSALADLTGRLPLMRVSDRLTDIAELIVQVLHGSGMAADDQDSRCAVRAAMTREAARTVKVAVAGYGKLGGLGARLRVGSRSRLPARFSGRVSADRRRAAGRQRRVLPAARTAHRAPSHDAFGGGPALRGRHAPAAQRQGRVSHDGDRRVRALSAPRGLDLGASGAAARAGGRAATTRCAGASRRCAGGAVQGRASRQLRKDVLDMRGACAASWPQTDPARFDIKQDPGGIADIEFLVQYWVLGAAAEHPRARRSFGQHPPTGGAGACAGSSIRRRRGGSRKPT